MGVSAVNGIYISVRIYLLIVSAVVHDRADFLAVIHDRADFRAVIHDGADFRAAIHDGLDWSAAKHHIMSAHDVVTAISVSIIHYTNLPSIHS